MFKSEWKNIQMPLFLIMSLQTVLSFALAGGALRLEV